MPLQLVTELNELDRRLCERAVEGFVPERVFDIHAHLFHSRHFAAGKCPEFLDEDRGYGLADFHAAMARWLPGRRVEGLFFGYPSAGNDRAGENEWVRDQVLPVAAQTASRALVLAAPEDGPECVARRLAEAPFIGIKPYRLYAPVADTREAAIEDFAPEWMWELCTARDGVLMLHLMRAGGITDPVNVEAIRRLCQRHPRCRLVLAHVARSFHDRHAREGLQALVDLDNVVVDTSAVTQAGAFRAALEILGPRRVLWGSDYMVSELRGACFSQGDGFTWIHPEQEAARGLTVFGGYTLVGIESLLRLREACEDLGLNAADLRDLFHDNARRLLAPHLPREVPPALAPGPELWSRAVERISCGTGLMSKRAAQLDPQTWPSYFSRASGAWVWDLESRRFTDFTGGVGALLLGHADPAVNAAVRRRLQLGSYSTLLSPDEPALAERLLGLHPWAGKVRFARGGGEALAMAVRIARAASGRSGIAFCGYHGWSDWYLAANLEADGALDGHLLPGLEPLGVPRALAGTARPFRYNDPVALQQALNRLGTNLAAVVMEPLRAEAPRDGFLQRVQAECRQRGAVFVLDEVTSGWRFGHPGAASALGVEPDLAVYAKAMSNGVPCAAVVGREAVMDAANASFISSSSWTDGLGPAAALACIDRLEQTGAVARVAALGARLQNGLRAVAARHPALRLGIGGQPCAPSLRFDLGDAATAARTLWVRGLLRRGFLASGQLYVMVAHDEGMIDALLAAADEVCSELAALKDRELLVATAGTGAQSGFARLA